jgi:chromodomain-helicase-DNA-binding protein 1
MCQKAVLTIQRFHVKWKGYSHIHNTDELYSFLKNYKGFKRVENYINKVWTVDQRFQGKDPEYQPTREEVEQYQIDKERLVEMYESCKVVERILNEKEERNEDGNLVTYFFCKWTSEYRTSCPVGGPN